MKYFLYISIVIIIICAAFYYYTFDRWEIVCEARIENSNIEILSKSGIDSFQLVLKRRVGKLKTNYALLYFYPASVPSGEWKISILYSHNENIMWININDGQSNNLIASYNINSQSVITSDWGEVSWSPNLSINAGNILPKKILPVSNDASLICIGTINR